MVRISKELILYFIPIIVLFLITPYISFEIFIIFLLLYLVIGIPVMVDLMERYKIWQALKKK